MYKYQIKYKDHDSLHFESRHHLNMLQPIFEDVFYFDDVGIVIDLSQVFAVVINETEHPVAVMYEA